MYVEAKYMIFRKLFLGLLSVLISASITFGQAKEEVFFQRTPDPIKSVAIYPNPATEFVSVKFETPIAKKIKISVHNVIGNVMELERETLDEYEIKIKVKDLATGYYLISVKDENSNLSSTYKFLKR